jgi:Phage integrase family
MRCPHTYLEEKMKIRFNKNDKRYWTRKVSFHTPADRSYSVSIQHANERRRIGLRTADKEEAGALALKFYLKLRALGWDETLRWWKGDLSDAKKSDVTVGEYVEAVAAKSLIHSKTLRSYSAALRKIASDIQGFSNGKRSRSTWRTQVDAIKLATLTSEKIEAWRADFIKRIGVNPIKEKSARVSTNSYISCARSLFGPDLTARVKDVIELPSPVPFTGVKVERVRVPRYRSSFDMATLLESARAELAVDRPEQYKIFLLASMAGLRRNEIDKLPWSAFRWNEGLIRIEATEHFRPKTHESAGDVVVDPGLIEIFRGYHAQRKGDFVIESKHAPDNGKPFEHYRCHSVFAELLAWLRSKGVVSRTPLHSLRKEFGSQINLRYGLFAASSMLRHADIAVTAAHYVENKQRSVLGFDHLLKGDRTIVPMREATRA